jgi:hypothetical protein
MPPAHRSPSKPLRMKMGITGTLIPDVTPRESMTPPSRHGEMKSDRRSLHTASGRRILSIEPNQTERK